MSVRLPRWTLRSSPATGSIARADRPLGQGQARALTGDEAAAIALRQVRPQVAVAPSESSPAGLARAMSMDPRIIFFDEPVTGLDPIIAAGIDDLILHLKSAFNITLVIVTHELKHAFAVADRLVMISEGKILAEGTPDVIKKSPHPEVRQFLEGKPDPRDVASGIAFTPNPETV